MWVNLINIQRIMVDYYFKFNIILQIQSKITKKKVKLKSSNENISREKMY